MVGDIIQDPLGGLVKGAVVAGSWAIGSAINAYKQNYDFVTDYGRDFLNNKFTTDDLVDVPPPPAEDIGTVEPDAPPAGGGQSSSVTPRKSFGELFTELVRNEAIRGIQSPIGPEDPNFVLTPVPLEQRNKDPQAPLKPGFVPSPEPAPASTLDANLILSYRSPFGPYPATPTSDLLYYPVFRGQKGSKKAISQNNWDVYGVPRITDGTVNWIARIQAKANGRIVATWDMDAGSKPPQAGDVDLRGVQTVLDLDFSLLEFPPGLGYSLRTFPLQQSAAPALIPIPPNPGESNTSDILASSIPSFSLNRPPWTSGPMDPPAESENLPGEGLLPRVPFPSYPTKPVVPPTAVPINPNNPIANPAIGTNGLPLKNIANIVQTGTDVHKIGDLTVNSGKIRATTSAIAKEVGRIEQKTASLQKNQEGIPWWLIGPLLDALAALLEQDIPGTTYTLTGICEKVPEGSPQPVAEFPVEPAKNLGAIINRLDTMDKMLQQHLAWKTPTCGNEKPINEGEWRTISFRSDSVSPYGKSRLRKRFRYRGQQGFGLGEVVDHWRDFTFQSGPVIVQHAGASWGTPQVWAATADEGKRVIRHASGEAGIDPDQDGRWIISSSDSARFGVSDTMRVDTKGGYYWITARDGSDQRPLVAKT